MTDFESIDALLAAAKPAPAPLPPAEERRRLREELHLSRAQLAAALGVSASTVGGWEAGREPGGEVREKYAYFLKGAATKLTSTAETASEPADVPVGEPGVDVDQVDVLVDVDALAAPKPCVLCGQPARQQVEGFPQHLDPTECTATAPAPAAEPAPDAGLAAPEQAGPPKPPRTERAVPPQRPVQPARTGWQSGRGTGTGVKVTPVGRRARAASDIVDPIGSAVAAVLEEHAGDVEAATAALVKRAIPDAMALLDHTRKGGRYDVVAHPWLPDILRKASSRGADQVWEARPKWTRPQLPAGAHEVTALDINGAYLSALKTHLPLGQLEHSTGNHHDKRRSGLHLITPPAWEHAAVLPNPVGQRDEPGPLWVTEPTLRLLQRVAGPRYGLCDPPEIHESWTSGSTEGLLEKFRIALREARDRAISEDDAVTLEYVKAMYSKFVSTLGESNYNRELYRTDWMHLIRSQAFANLWTKAHRAYDEGLMVVRAMGTDELHVVGDWRAVFPEGRHVTEVKVKDVYTVGTDTNDPQQPQNGPDGPS
ncbi:helix-turn-helix domain-containing protein (plasmid) [Streptomyces sp. NBC_01558]|uniref:helix-turn-helix domain-containing protein n=1 Tax=Streptomyces sp. NBC_01558 TaxID=2975878 RepID=UPI002DD98E8F|nr:helix-turn-helix transcriptional regulator [Streptomyces sp. NBC_01558]WSD82729.1 helix-turn-helix domain-containing protein [Streptomyces sp. NBC_01558]